MSRKRDKSSKPSKPSKPAKGPRPSIDARAGAPVRRDAEGRAHLVVDPGSQGRGRSIRLSAPLFREAWQNDVAAAAAGTTHRLLDEGHTVAQAVALGRHAMAAASTIVDGALAQAPPDGGPACRPGCAHCCHQPVGVSPPEVFAIHDHLRATRTPDELAAVAGRIRAAGDRARGRDIKQRISPDMPCPFLSANDARCTIYEVRPLSCRGMNSLDASACERALREPAARAAFLAGASSIPCFLEPIRAVHAVAAGMQLALDEIHGLEVLPLDLTAAMRIVLENPESVAAEWLAGRDPFAAARGADTTDDPRMEELSGRIPRP